LFHDCQNSIETKAKYLQSVEIQIFELYLRSTFCGIVPMLCDYALPLSAVAKIYASENSRRQKNKQ
jgi:hypothetical protein